MIYMKILGLCFLIYDKINHEDLWSNWLKNIDTDKYRIYIHYKTNVKLKYFEQYKITNCIETTWGRYTITLAQNLMMKQGIDECTHFIFLSGSCIPLKSFDYVYDQLSTNRSYFNKAPDRHYSRCNNVLKYMDKQYIKKANTNSIICNEHAKKIINNEHIAKEYFTTITSADEHIHISILYSLNLEEELVLTPNTSYSGATTFAAWDDMIDFRVYNNSVKSNSYTYIHICKEELDDLINGKCLFGRKFNTDCKVIKTKDPFIIIDSLSGYLSNKFTDINGMDEDKVTVVIPTYNRFKYLINTIKSVKEQTHTNIEIIVVNDCSTEKDYYQYNWGEQNVRIIHLSENSKTKFGFACPGGYQRNFGIKEATGNYIAFCDDDDIWFPQKLELQLKAMKENDCKMSCTDGLIGNGIYDKTKSYKKYNKEHFLNILKNIYKNKGSSLMENGFPLIWNSDFFKVHNCAICSSVVIKKDIIDQVGEFIVARHSEDYEYWRRTVELTNCVYVDEPCIYYDSGHGDGQCY